MKLLLAIIGCVIAFVVLREALRPVSRSIAQAATSGQIGEGAAAAIGAGLGVVPLLPAGVLLLMAKKPKK